MSIDKPVRWAELFKKEFEERLQAMPLVYLPMGICEPHGHISVLGLDTIKADYLCDEAASRWGGIVAPSLGYQIHETGYHAPWLAEVAGNVNTLMTSMPPAPMLYFFLYQLRAFHNAGFKRAMVITGHAGGNQQDFRLAAKLFMKHSEMKVSVFSDPELTDGKYEGDHAGKYEISQLLYLRPAFIKMDRLKDWDVNKPETRFAQGLDAAEADAEYGNQILEDCLAGIKNVLDQNSPSEPADRALLPYETVESVWHDLKVNYPKWITATTKEGQDLTDERSVWKSFEKYQLPG